jgi:hypothetical protein
MQENIALGQQMGNLVLLGNRTTRDGFDCENVTGCLFRGEKDTSKRTTRDTFDKFELADRAAWPNRRRGMRAAKDSKGF